MNEKNPNTKSHEEPAIENPFAEIFKHDSRTFASTKFYAGIPPDISEEHGQIYEQFRGCYYDQPSYKFTRPERIGISVLCSLVLGQSRLLAMYSRSSFGKAFIEDPNWRRVGAVKADPSKYRTGSKNGYHSAISKDDYNGAIRFLSKFYEIRYQFSASGLQIHGLIPESLCTWVIDTLGAAVDNLHYRQTTEIFTYLFHRYRKAWLKEEEKEGQDFDREKHKIAVRHLFEVFDPFFKDEFSKLFKTISFRIPVFSIAFADMAISDRKDDFECLLALFRKDYSDYTERIVGLLENDKRFERCEKFHKYFETYRTSEQRYRDQQNPS